MADDTPVNSTKIMLNDGEMVTYSRPDGKFVFYNVPYGVHLIDVHSHTLHFGQVKVQLSPDVDPKCIIYDFPGSPKQVVKYPIQLRANAVYEYFEKKSGFSPFALLKNPMMLMMLFSIGMMYFMPKMMENLEPEERERMQKQLKAQQNPSEMLSNLWNDLSGVTEEPPVKAFKKK